MTIGEIKKMNLPDDTEIEINAIFDEEKNDLRPVSCGGFYHKKDKKVYLTPDIISI